MVALLPGRIVHAYSRCVQPLVFGTRVEVDGTTRILGRGAQVPGGAGAAVGAAEHCTDAWGTDLIAADTPGHRGLALRAGDVLVLPVDREVALLVGLLRLARPLRHGPDWSFERDTVVASALPQQGGIDIGRVHKVLGRQQALVGKTLVDVG